MTIPIAYISGDENGK